MSEGSPGPAGSRFASGATFALLPLALTLLADFPGRRACAIREAQFGRPAWEFFVGGLVGDLAGVMPILSALLIGLWLARSLANARRGAPPSPASERAWRAATVVVLALATGVFWLMSEGASEFKIQRGLYPTYYETKMGLGDASFVLGSLPVLLLDRYLWPTVVAGVGAGLALWWYVRRERLLGPISWPLTSGLAGGCLLVVAFGGAGLVMNETLFPSVGHRRELYPPLVTLYKGLVTQKKTAVFRGLRAVFMGAHFDEAREREGARELGFSDADAQAILAPAPDCSRHPLARPLTLGGAQAASAASSPIVQGLAGLSGQLFAGRSDDITIWQIAIESFRADDVAGLNPQAAREIAPFTSSLYDAAQAPAPNVIAFRDAYQGGMRTSQAVSALMCGLGALPFNMALLRDVGYAPLRCLPDVLSDAGIKPRVFYGADMSFDNMLEFFRYHGARTTEKTDFPRGLPTGTWDCITDDPLFAHAFDESIKDDASQYNFVLTLTGHTPFGRPSDLPAEVERRVKEGVKGAGMQVGDDDLARLYTVSYTDWALERFVHRLDASAQAGRSIVVVSADHSTGDPFVWKSGWSLQASARIPFLIYFPEAFLEKSGDAAASRQRLAALDRIAERAPVSANDVPSLLLALLAASPQLAQVPPAWRWHTIGGQATSPDYRVTARPQSLIWGINADAQVFSVDADGTEPVDTHERSESFSDVSQVTRLGPVLDPAAALLSSFLNGYGSKCTGPENVRSSGVKTPTH
jgi:hypothetical protein